MTLQQRVSAPLLLLIALSWCAGGASLHLLFDNGVYGRNNRLSYGGRDVVYDGSLVGRLENFSPANISLGADLGLTNAFSDTTHKIFEVRSLYAKLGPVLGGLEVKLGRQMRYDLLSRDLFLDGVGLAYRVGTRFSLGAYGGLPLPSRYSSYPLQGNMDLLAAGVQANVEACKGTWVGVLGAREKEFGRDQQFPVGAYVDSRIGPVLGVRGNAAFEITQQTWREYAVDLRLMPLRSVVIRAFLLGQDQGVDSVNAYDSLVLGTHTDLGGQFRLTSTRGDWFTIHYALRLLDSGVDHLAGIGGSLRGVHAHVESGIGASGSSIKTTLGYRISILQDLVADASASQYHFKLTVNPAWENSLVARLSIRWRAPSLGLSVEPQLEYLTNEYYRNDLRVWLNAQYSFSRFWKS